MAAIMVVICFSSQAISQEPEAHGKKLSFPMTSYLYKYFTLVIALFLYDTS